MKRETEVKSGTGLTAAYGPAPPIAFCADDIGCNEFGNEEVKMVNIQNMGKDGLES